MSMDIKLSRQSRIYHPSETIEGVIITEFPTSISHQGIHITATGTVNMQIGSGMARVMDSLYNVVKPICIVKKSMDIASGKMGSGRTEIPFAMSLTSQGDVQSTERFYETFHGLNISIQYLITADLKRGYLHKSLSATVEFIIESDKRNLMRTPVSPKVVNFYITQDTQNHQLLPEILSGGFRVSGKVPTQCSLSDPLSGELTIEASAVPIQSIDVLLLRVESFIVGERNVTETSVVQTTQVADGDVCRNLTLPIYVILPRLLTCPTTIPGSFSIEFEVAIVISFKSELSTLHPKTDLSIPRLWLAKQTFPLKLYRTT